MRPKKVSETRTEIAQLMTPMDANVLGNVFGGVVLSLIDLTAGATAQRFAETICVTASFDRVDFHEPIFVGEHLALVGYVSSVGRTSLEVTVEVRATNLIQGTSRRTNTARVTMVALRDGKTAEVPRLICETREDKLRFLLGKHRRESRVDHVGMHAQVWERLSKLSDAELDEMIASSRPVRDYLADLD